MTRLHAETAESMHALLAPPGHGSPPRPLQAELGETAMAVSTGLLPPLQLWALLKVRGNETGRRASPLSEVQK
jgi:hypothetical protein